MPIRSAILCSIMVAAMAAVSPPARAGEASGGLDKAAARSVMREIDRTRRLSSVYAQCPADRFRQPAPGRSTSSRLGEITDETCDGRVQECFRACTKERDGEACFGLARSFQRHEDDVPARYGQILFTLACAAGNGAGCTNRAAGIRNGDHDGDPFQGRLAASAESCQFRSFKVACKEEDAWGCAMLGQSYRYGEGTTRNLARARRVYEQACELAPDFEACEFARSDLKEIAQSRR